MALLGVITADADFSQMTGTQTNDNASAGNIGEYIEGVVLEGVGVSLVTGSAKSVTSIPLTAGDWDVEGMVRFEYTSATTTGDGAVCASTTTNTLADVGNTRAYDNSRLTTTTCKKSVQLARTRVKLIVPTTIFLIALTTFSAGTAAASGIICARRSR